VTTPNQIAEAVEAAEAWNVRVAIIRTVPEAFGLAQHAAVYAAIAERVYVPTLRPDYAYVHTREEYELAPLSAAYGLAYERTAGFTRVSRQDLARVLMDSPSTLRVFRLLLGFTGSEFAETCNLVAERFGMSPVGKGRVSSVEEGRRIAAPEANTCAAAIDLVMTRDPGLFPPTPAGSTLRRKIEKPDTASGWQSVRQYASTGVPFDVFLHQRAYGGAFRQLLDATSTERGDLVEDPVERLFTDERVPFVRTGAQNQAAIEDRWGLTVKPAPDFALFDDRTDTLRAILECKGANDGGTARDKAARFGRLRAEGQRLGGIPLFAVLAGIGWRRTADALGPVVRDTDGRVFTLATLPRILETEPVPSLRGLADRLPMVAEPPAPRVRRRKPGR
jgi:hypothetical protein